MTVNPQSSQESLNENLDRRPNEDTNHGEQVRHMRKYCEDMRREPGGIQDLIEDYYRSNKGPAEKEKIKLEFKRRLRALSPDERAIMGITSATNDISEPEIDAFLSSTECFENQLMSQIDSDRHAREIAEERMLDDCLLAAHDDFGDFEDGPLRTALKNESTSRKKTFLDTPKYRRKYIKGVPGYNSLRELDFQGVDFGDITKKIGLLIGGNPDERLRIRKIQEAWLKIASVAAPGESLVEAFSRYTKEGGTGIDLAGAYEVFFSDENTCVSQDNRKKIMNFLINHSVPLITLSVLELVDPTAYEAYLAPTSTALTDINGNLPPDEALATALKKDKEDYWKKLVRTAYGAQDRFISTRGLSDKAKLRILSQFGSIGSAEKLQEYFRGHPHTLVSSLDTGEEARNRFMAMHDNLDPETIDTRTGLLRELVAKLGHKIHGLENFDHGCVMQWKTLDERGNSVIGYYILDTVPSDDPDNENLITCRFLGHNNAPLSPNGLESFYTGSRFYDYLSDCVDQGEISFVDRNSFNDEIEKNEKEKRYPRYHTDDETQAELRSRFPEDTDVKDEEQMNRELDKIINEEGSEAIKAKEAKSPSDREIKAGTIFVKKNINGTIDTFEVDSIGGGDITLYDGHGSKKKGSKSYMTMPLTDFILTIKGIKQALGDQGELYRLPAKAGEMDVEEFNRLCGISDLYGGVDDPGAKKMKQIRINKDEKKGNVFGCIDKKTGVFQDKPIIKIGGGHDLWIKEIVGNKVTYCEGEFVQAKQNDDKSWTTPLFKGGDIERTMSLPMLWARLSAAPTLSFDKPDEDKKPVEIEKKNKNNSLSWLNILLSAHSLGVILHGDIWSAPFKAWEEQHHKDHAFSGKMATALAAEKLQSGHGLASNIWNKFEFPALMVADGNATFQNYLDELVKKIDDMGSAHRVRLIQKWGSTEHFPSAKFMAAMFASMQIFGQLYPYDEGIDEHNPKKSKDKRNQPWFWYNSICHSLDPNHSNPEKFPHMPPHEGDKWPKVLLDDNGNLMSEIQACNKLFSGFQHPLLKNLGRRFQKYSHNGHDKLKSGGITNLNEKTTMEGKLEWMMNSVLSQKHTEAFGDATEIWLKEQYPTEISTMPYMALLVAGKETQILPETQEHIKKQFQEEGVKIPMFLFMQNKNLGDTFRKTLIAFAYTLGMETGKELEDIMKGAKGGRLDYDAWKGWIGQFSKFWKKNGTVLMHKLTGMRDPMLNLMINDPTTFDELVKNLPKDKQKEYEYLNKNRDAIGLYVDRLTECYNSPKHTGMPRDKAFYTGDHFRYRKNFNTGFPMFWVNWDAFIDGNLDKTYASGESATSGDGIFNEIRGFMYDIPELAQKMAKNMGIIVGKDRGNGDKYTEADVNKLVQKVAKGIFVKNRQPMGRLMEQLIKAQNPEAEYCSMTAMMLGIMDVRRLQADDDELQKIYGDYYHKMVATVNRAKELEEQGKWTEAIKYRADMAKRWSTIVRAQVDLREAPMEKVLDEKQNAKSLAKKGTLDEIKNRTQAESAKTLTSDKAAFESLAKKGSQGQGGQLSAGEDEAEGANPVGNVKKMVAGRRKRTMGE